MQCNDADFNIMYLLDRILVLLDLIYSLACYYRTYIFNGLILFAQFYNFLKFLNKKILEYLVLNRVFATVILGLAACSEAARGCSTSRKNVKLLEIRFVRVI